MKQYIVDAFTDRPFSGNPAAVCVMEHWPDEASMKKLARENNLSETAFLVREERGYHLRWFTPGTEVDLCGHATLASAYVILNHYCTDSDAVCFHTRSGALTVRCGRFLSVMRWKRPLACVRSGHCWAWTWYACLRRRIRCGACSQTRRVFSSWRAGFRMPLPGAALRTAYPAASVPSWPLQRIQYAVQPIARSRHTGQKCCISVRFMPSRRPSAEDICTAKSWAMVGFRSADRLLLWGLRRS